MKRDVRVVGLFVVLVTVITGIGGCNSPTTNSRVSPPPPATPVLMSIKLTGSTSFTGAGQTSKLTATGTFSDQTTADISAKVQWTSSVISVATLSATGVLTTAGLGATDIYARSSANPILYSNSLHATVTPPGTFVVLGWTREPGNGPLGGVLVLNQESGQSMLSVSGGDSQGLFSLGGLTTGHFVFTKADYEDTVVDLAPDFNGDVPLQRIVHLAPGSAVSLELAPHDLDYLVAPNTHCSPCKMIRVTSPGPMTLRVKLTWTDKTTHLVLWANGQEFAPADSALEAVADLPVGAGDTMVYVASLASLPSSTHVPFTVSSTVVTVAQRTR